MGGDPTSAGSAVTRHRLRRADLSARIESAFGVAEGEMNFALEGGDESPHSTFGASLEYIVRYR